MRRIPLRRSQAPSSRWTPSGALACIATALCALACGSSSGSGSGSGNEREFENMSVVRYPGGYGGAPASPESTCAPHADPDSLGIDQASRQLSWEFCHFDAPDLYTPQRGQRVITEGELESVEEALGRLTAGTPEGMCGADGGVLTLDVRAEATTGLYISSSSCPPNWSDGRTPATGISDLWLELQALSGG